MVVQYSSLAGGYSKETAMVRRSCGVVKDE